MRRNSITLHPEHGVNPALGACFWCGGDSGEVLLLGYNKGEKADDRMVANYDPCSKCKDQWDTGIVLMQATDNPIDDRPEFQRGIYVTGNWAVITEDAARRLFNGEFLEEIIDKGVSLIDEDAWNEIGLNDSSSIKPEGDK